MCYSQRSQAKNARCRHRREQVISTSTPKRSGTCFTIVWMFECKATDSLHKTCGNDTSLPSKQKKISHKEALDLTTRQNNSEPGKKSNKKIRLSIMFDTCVIPKDHKQKTPDADTGENRSFPRPLQRGVEHVLRWSEYSSAKQSTIYTRHMATTQVFYRSRKKPHKEALDHATRQIAVNRKKIPNKNSPFMHVRTMC